jgi:hypothetical protein
MDRKMSRYIDIAVIVAALLIIAMVAVAKGTEPIVFCESPEVQSRQGYPLRSTWWTVGGRYPDRQTMISHLSQGQHAGKWDLQWLRSLTREELHSLHSDDHEGLTRPEAVAAVKRFLFVPIQERQIVVVTNKNCSPCQRWKAKEKPLLQSKGYQFGTAGQFVERSSYPGVRLVPTFILEISGKKRYTLTGYQTAKRLVQLLVQT